ncbi:glycoside hydrolase family 43 protein [Catonella massiliensis]|uniref:Glycoside hydrolase family 43 protein n=1 Tax=Catonella massiliensis TaxID=2799636 RepID=A0ABS1J458_9FIRM|nr:glycoside hydrolase family 43 protein [Catonella massiliensis]MBK5898855.1 glycoside hydrolase family 43 protein [Catonella massiliensis]
MIKNPILTGFNPDPCICRKGDDFYIAVSSFEWLPGIPIYHSKDLKHWELYTHVLTLNSQVELRKLPSAKGVWAPCLTYCEEEDSFYVIYGVMNSMNARYFDVDNYLIKAKDIRGPWTEPVYLHSAGFDASILHDDDGRKYIVSLEWETRDGYEKPGVICVAEYDTKNKCLKEYPKRVYNGGTDRGCIEAPHLTKRGEYYYLMCAEGGTGYNHCVTMARSKSPYGPFEKDPMNPILTSSPNNSNERADWDHLKPRYYNPESALQKSGHGSYVNLDEKTAYLVHLCARPFVPELRCTLGRESAIQKMVWTDDGWLRMADGTNLAKIETEEADLPAFDAEILPDRDDFDETVLRKDYYSPRIFPSEFTDCKSREGFIRLRGQESLSSLNRVSLLCRKLPSVEVEASVCLDFNPEIYQHSAGLVLYYDNMNYIALRKYYSDTLKQPAVAIISLENGEKKEHLDTRTAVDCRMLRFELIVSGRESYFKWGYEGEDTKPIGPVFATDKLSDEYCKYGEFTGTMVGIFAVDSMFHKKEADFDYFSVTNKEE